MSVCKNVFEAILKYGHDEDFDPEHNEYFLPTDAPAGSSERLKSSVVALNWANRCGMATTASTTQLDRRDPSTRVIAQSNHCQMTQAL